MRLPALTVPAFSLLLAAAQARPAPDVTPVKRWIETQKDLKTFFSEFQQERELRSLKRPIVTQGRVWFAEPGSFRWELGQPPATIAVQKSRQDLLILEPKKKKGKRYTVEELREEGRARGAAFLDAGFPRDYATFEKLFKVTEVTHVGGTYEVTASIRDRKTSLALRKVVFSIDARSYELRKLYLRFRDSSSITTTFRNVKKNPSIPSGTFTVDLTGYELKTK